MYMYICVYICGSNQSKTGTCVCPYRYRHISNQSKTRMAMLISDNIDFRAKKIT